MMSVGTDLQGLAELRAKTDLFGNRAVLTPYERAYCEQKRDPWSSLGGILCAKEACLKALSAYDLPAITFIDLEIQHDPTGRPVLRPGARLGPWLSARGLAVSLSISHSAEYAMAVAVASPIHCNAT